MRALQTPITYGIDNSFLGLDRISTISPSSSEAYRLCTVEVEVILTKFSRISVHRTSQITGEMKLQLNLKAA